MIFFKNGLPCQTLIKVSLTSCLSHGFGDDPWHMRGKMTAILVQMLAMLLWCKDTVFDKAYAEKIASSMA